MLQDRHREENYYVAGVFKHDFELLRGLALSITKYLKEVLMLIQRTKEQIDLLLS